MVLPRNEIPEQIAHLRYLLGIYANHIRILDEQIATLGSAYAPASLLIQRADNEAKRLAALSEMQGLERELGLTPAVSDAVSNPSPDQAPSSERRSNLSGAAAPTEDWQPGENEMSKGFAQGHALIIGIANYPQVSPLPDVVLKDARDVAELLGSADYCGYHRTNLELLLDEQATADGIRDGLRRLARRTGSEDTAVVFFSGHGGRIENGPDAGAYLIPFNCDPRRLRDTGVGSEELTILLSEIKAQRLVVLLDACHSSGAGELKAVAPVSQVKSGLDEQTYRALAEGTGRVIMSSSRSDEVSLILNGMHNSLFTHYLLDALKGACPTHGDGLVRVFDVFHYISDNVPIRASQHPIFKARDVENNFPLALCLGGKQPASPQSAKPPATVIVPRPAVLSGRVRLAIMKHTVTRWPDLATYFEIPLSDQATFEKGREPQRVLDWLEQRKRLHELRDAFNFLGWDDLIVELHS